ncbi:MAG: methyltransferase domain-containing protein [Candidatus Scalindua sp.]|nr:methyltransferase domain-containing protein [Candidatus Scalindua sp.]
MSNAQQTDTRISWSNVFRNRDEIHKRYNSIWKVPVLRKRLELVRSLMKDGARILDVGAGNSEWGRRLKRIYADIIFKTVDVDPALSPDYGSLHEVEEHFDLIISWEVIEHLTLQEGEDLIRECARVLQSGACLVMSTPNIFNPSCYLMDSTHRTPYSYEELGGLCLRAGLEVQEIYRTYNASRVKFFLKRIFIAPFHRMIGVDYTKSVIVVARKPSG